MPMYAVRDAEGRFVGQARSKVSAHRRMRRMNMAGAGSFSKDNPASPYRWQHVKKHDAWVRHYEFAAVPGFSKTREHAVAVRRDGDHWRADLSSMMGFEALTSTHYPTAQAAKDDADKIMRVFKLARSKGAEIDIQSMVGNDGKIRWHDTHLGLAGVRREDFNMARGRAKQAEVRIDNRSVLRRAWSMPIEELFNATMTAGQKTARAAKAWADSGYQDKKLLLKSDRYRAIERELDNIFDVRGGQRWLTVKSEIDKENAEAAHRKWVRTGTASGAKKRHIRDIDWKARG